MASCPPIMEKQWKQWQTLFSWAPKSLKMVICSHEIKRHLLFGRKAMTSLLLLLLSHFSCVQLCVTPETAAHQVPPSLGFSRQEHWSGLPFPSPMHESEKWKWSHSVVSHSSQPHGLQPTRLLRPWDFPGTSTGVGCHCLLWYLSCLNININGSPSICQ